MKGGSISIRLAASIVAVSVALSVFSILSVLSIHQAYASSCFTDTSFHWAETYICWLRANGLSTGYPDGSFRPDNYITRAEVASLIYHEATSGDVYVNGGSWFPDSGGSTAAIVSPNAIYLPVSGGGQSFINLPEIPSSLFGRQMQLKGVQLCYARSTGLTLSQVTLAVWNNGNFDASVDDSTPRTDSACRIYLLSAPDPLKASEYVSLRISATSASLAYLDVYSTTYILSPTPNGAVLGP